MPNIEISARKHSAKALQVAVGTHLINQHPFCVMTKAKCLTAGVSIRVLVSFATALSTQL